MKKKTIAVLLVLLLLVPLFSGCLEEERVNHKPNVTISYPKNDDIVFKIVTISGIATDSDGDKTIKHIEVQLNGEWELADGTNLWSYTWRLYDVEDGLYTVSVRAWDGADYSEVEDVTINVDNPDVVESDEHKWAVFIVASNFPIENESKLGNGGLYLAEEMSAFFIENLHYPTSNIFILFDDGWMRKDNGFGERMITLQERYHKYDITYAGATRDDVTSTLENVIYESNNFDDSEVFIWISSHGCGDEDIALTGGKILERSGIFLWDHVIEDKDLGVILSNLRSKKTCVIVDACFSGGFADKTIFSFPEFFLFRSDVPTRGRVVITGASKFRVGYASTEAGPLFTQLWYYGLKTGEADGFRPGLLHTGRPSMFEILQNGKVSVEEAFYYARYVLKNDKSLRDYSNMEPQINDQYPLRGPIVNSKGLILGE